MVDKMRIGDRKKWFDQVVFFEYQNLRANHVDPQEASARATDRANEALAGAFGGHTEPPSPPDVGDTE